MLDSAVEILNQGLSKHPDGIYAESIKFEIGLCHLDDENNKRAFDIFKKIAERKIRIWPLKLTFLQVFV
jgi:hypothetical protein